MSSRLALEATGKRYGDTVAVDEVSLALEPGRFTALIGASGCGKSTTLRLFAGLEQPTSGRVLLDDRDVTLATASQRNVALMFQSYALYPHLTVFDNIAMPLRLRRLRSWQRLPGLGALSSEARTVRAAIRKEVGRMAETLRLSALLERKPGQLSGGQQQRVALARALVRQPTAFLLDEPLSNLDTQLRARTREEIRSLHRSTGYPFLLVTHDQVDALSMADDIAVMIDGRIVQKASPQRLYAEPATPAVAAFLGTHGMTLLPAGPAALLHPAGARLGIGVRPDEILLDPRGGVEGVVSDVAFQGSETLVSLRCTDAATLTVVVRGGQALPVAGERVRVSVPDASLHFFDPATDRRVAPGAVGAVA